MKKILSGILALLMTAPTVCSAAVKFTTVDPAEDIIRLSCDTGAEDNITFIVLNPGHTYEDYTSGDEGKRTESIRYIGLGKSENDEAHVTFALSGDAGGTFTAFANGEKLEFEYYPMELKKKFLSDMKNGTETDMEKLIKIFGFSDEDIYKKGNKEDIILRLSKKKDFSDDVSVVYDEIFEEILLSDFASGKSEAVFANGKLLYAEKLGISDMEEYNDYISLLNKNGLKDVENKLLSKNYSSIADFQKEFKKSIYFNLIMNYKDNGYGHMQEIFEKYSSEYKDYGVNFPARENRSAYQALLGSGAETLEDMGKKLKSLLSQKSDGKSSGSGSAGSSSQNHGVSQNTGGKDFVNPNEDKDEDNKKLYSDVEDSFWAFEAIKNLSENNVLTGYENGAFLPQKSVTRAEFSKMISLVFNLKGGTGAFDDVSDTDWFAPYIHAAADKGIVFGSDGKFRPNDNITRQDAAVMIFRAYSKTKKTSDLFKDDNEISEYAKEAVYDLSSQGVIKGYDDNTFRALANLSRAEAASLLSEIMKGEK